MGVVFLLEVDMTVREFLLKHTKVKELCVVRDSGYILMTACIDYEDLFVINNNIGSKIVKYDTWGTIPIRNRNGSRIDVDCHYIDI